MVAEIIMPQLGETVAEGKIVTWFKKVGDAVKTGDRLFEVETDKVTIDVEAIENGTITEILTWDGEIAKIGRVVAILDGAGAKTSATVEQSGKLPTEETAVAVHQPAADIAAAQFIPANMSPNEEVRTPTDRFGKALATDGMRITPLARRLIAQNGLDLAMLSSSVRAKGASKISERDVRAALDARTALPKISITSAAGILNPRSPDIVVGQGENRVAFSTIRQKTADRLAENWRTIPHVFQAIEVDFTEIDKTRSRHKDAFKTATGVSLTFLPFIIRAVVLTLREFPQINAKTDGRSLVVCRDINIGIAVDLAHKGLVVPVLRNADEFNVGGIARGIGRLIEKARGGKLSADDLSGGTYSITNNGSFGTMFTAPIINAPQVAILSVDAIRKRATVISTEAGDFIAPRLMGMVGQSFDHRAFDGAYSAAFLSRMKAMLETRDWASELE